jgi:hypothetical protein
VKVHRDEGVANRIGPESCVRIREGWGEASTGECAGQPLSRERSHVPGADAVQIAEGNTCGRVSASARRPGVVEDPGMRRQSLHGNRETSHLTSGARPVVVRIGKARSRSR